MKKEIGIECLSLPSFGFCLVVSFFSCRVMFSDVTRSLRKWVHVYGVCVFISILAGDADVDTTINSKQYNIT